MRIIKLLNAIEIPKGRFKCQQFVHRRAVASIPTDVIRGSQIVVVSSLGCALWSCP